MLCLKKKKKKIKCINIFDGKNEVTKPDKIEEIKGAVSLNFKQSMY